MDFRCAKTEEFTRVRDFYWRLIDRMEGGPFDPGWRRSVYPSDDELRDALGRGELWLLEDGADIAAAVIVNNDCNPGYEGLPWAVEAPPERVYMLHTLGVDPDRQGRGVARRVVEECLALARSRGAACVRLDVLGGNEPAERLYTRAGFRFVAAREMFYEDTGWTEFRMFEFPL